MVASRTPRRFMRQGTADLQTQAQVDAYTGPYGEVIVTPKGQRVQDGVTPGGLRMIAEQFLAGTVITLPSGEIDALGTILSLASDFLVVPAAGETVQIPAGVARVIVRGGAPHFRLLLPPSGDDGRLRIEVEEGTSQTRVTIQCVPSSTDRITDGFLPATRVPLTVQFDRVTALVRTGGVWTIGDASAPSAAMALDLVNGAYRYGYITPPQARSLTQMLAFQNGGGGSTYVGADGTCRDAPANTLRETYDPATGAYLGALFEAFQGENWVANATSAAGPAYNVNSVGSPALSTDVPRFYNGAAVHKITPDAGNVNCGSLSVDVPAGSSVCVSLYVWIPPESSGTLSEIFRIQNVTSGLTNSAIQSAAFGLRACWQRVSVVITNAGAALVTSQVRLVASGIRSPGDVQFPNRDLYVTCPQVERGVDFPSSLVPNPTSNVPAIRQADAVAFAAGMPLDTLSGFTLVAEMIAPALRQSGAGGGIGLGNDAAGSVSSARLRPFGDPAQPYLDAPLTGRTSATVARLTGSPVTPGRPIRGALAVSDDDLVLEDSLGARAPQMVGAVPDGLGLAPIIDAASGPLVLRQMEFFRSRLADTTLRADARRAGPFPATINPSVLGQAIPVDFNGLSFETSHVAGKAFNSDTNLLAMVRTLGPNGVLRIGGAASDGATYPSDANLQSLARFVLALGAGWTLIYGLNYLKNEPAEAARQAKLLTDILGAARVTFQIGNEPDLYGGTGVDFPTYAARWQTYRDAVVALVPGARFGGPDAASAAAKSNELCRLFATNLGTQCTMLTRHLYGAGVGFAQVSNVEDVWRNRVAAFTGPLLKGYATPAGLQCRLTEGGSINGSANFQIASWLGPSLWLLEASVALAQAGWAGVNWHGAPNANPAVPIVNGYSPIRLEADGTYRPLPTLFAMLAFKPLQGGRFVPLTGKLPAETPAWGVRGADGKTRVLVLNKDRFRTAQVNLASTGALSGGLSYLLTGSRWDSPYATFGGATVAPDGTFTPVGLPIAAAGGVLPIVVPPSSAAVVELT